MYDCSYFWRAVSISSDGSVEPCCHYNAGLDWTIERLKDKEQYKNYKASKKITDWQIQNHQTLTDIRQSALDNVPPAGCMPCVIHEKNGIKSPRQKGYDFQLAKNPIPDNEKTVKRPIDYIEHMDLFLNNICNFKCVMCSKEFSHLIAKEQGEEQPIVSWGDNEKHILKFMSKAKNLKKITIAGGEPFYNISYLHKIMETLLPIAHNIKFHITTNGSNKITQETADMLNKFRTVTLSISVDAIGKYSEIQRYRSSWKEVDANIKHMRSMFGKNVEMELNTTITAVTVHNLPDLLVWANGNPAIDWIHPCFVAYPDYLRCDILKPRVIKEIRDKIISLHKRIKFREQIDHPDVLGQILNSLQNIKSTDKYRDQFLDYFEELKQKRGLDLHKQLPDFKNWLM